MGAVLLLCCYKTSLHPPPPNGADGPMDTSTEEGFEDRIQVDPEPDVFEILPEITDHLDISDPGEEEIHIPPEPLCLSGPLDPVDYNNIVEFHSPEGEEENYIWTDALAVGDEIFVAVTTSIWSWKCFILLLPDMRQVWSSEPIRDFPLGQVVKLESGLAIFDVGSTITWAMIYPAGELVLSPRTTEGYDWPSAWSVVGAIPSGGFMVLWNEGWEIRARGYDVEGTPLGDVVLVTTEGRYPRFIQDPYNIIIAYHSTRSGFVTGPVVQELNPDGSPNGEPVYPAGEIVGSNLHGKRVERGIAAVWIRSSGGSWAGTVMYSILGDSLMPLVGPLEVASGTPDRIGMDGEDGAVLVAVSDYFIREGWSDFSYIKIIDDVPGEKIALSESTGISKPFVVYTREGWAVFWTENSRPKAVRISRF